MNAAGGRDPYFEDGYEKAAEAVEGQLRELLKAAGGACKESARTAALSRPHLLAYDAASIAVCVDKCMKEGDCAP